jgi:multidrug efflux pump subunit AcrB
MLAVMGMGAWTLVTESVPIEVFPDMPSRFISVNVPYPGATPEEVEETIVLRIEEALQQVTGIKRIVSMAGSSGGNVMMEIYDADKAREIIDDIKIRIDAIPNFPALAERPIIQHDDHLNSVISVILSADMAERDLRRLGEQVRDEIAALPGISHADLAGVRPYEISIEIPEAELRKHGLTLDQISTAIRSSAIDLPAGVVKTEAGDVSIRTRGRAYSVCIRLPRCGMGSTTPSLGLRRLRTPQRTDWFELTTGFPRSFSMAATASIWVVAAQDRKMASAF